MAKHVATVTFEFDDEDLAAFGQGNDAHDALFGELQSFPFGEWWINQITADGLRTIVDA